MANTDVQITLEQAVAEVLTLLTGVDLTFNPVNCRRYARESGLSTGTGVAAFPAISDTSHRSAGGSGGTAEPYCR